MVGWIAWLPYKVPGLMLLQAVPAAAGGRRIPNSAHQGHSAAHRHHINNTHCRAALRLILTGRISAGLGLVSTGLIQNFSIFHF